MHTDFLKRILKVKKSTPNIMLYGDLGRVPLSTGIKKRAVGFWYDMILSKDKLSSIIFQISLHDAVHNNHRYNWLHFV